MKNKFILLLIILSCTYAHSYAHSQERRDSHREWQLNCNIGTSLNLIGHSSDPNSGLLSTRPAAVPALDFRLTRYFTPRLGVCTGLHLNYYKEKKSDYLEGSFWGDFAEELFDEIFWPVSIVKPAIDAGIVYRIEQGRWSMSGTLGAGYMCYINDRNVSKTTGNYPSGNTTLLEYKQEGSMPYLNIGLAANYFVSKRCFVSLNADFQQPIGKAYAERAKYENSIQVNKISYQTSAAGRNLHLGVGFGFTF